MNAKTLEAVTKHGNALLQAFPNATERNPVALCKKLRRIETAISQVTLKNCNVGVPEAELDAATDKAVARVAAILGLKPHIVEATGLHVNRDPRGYALKMDGEKFREYNDGQRQCGEYGLPLHTDWGGYVILAPDLTA